MKSSIKLNTRSGLQILIGLQKDINVRPGLQILTGEF